MSESKIDEIGEELASGDEETVGADECASNPVRRGFGDIERRRHGSHSDSESHEDSTDDDHPRRWCKSHDDCTHKEEDVGYQDRHFPSEPIVDPTAHRSTEDRTGNRHAHNGFLQHMQISVN